jgi:hypothetical protein
VNGLHHAQAALPPGKRPRYPVVGGWMDPRTGLDDIEK